MGAQLSLLAQTAPSIAISSYVDVLDEIHYISQLNSSRFLKTCKALDPNGEILIKVFIKPADDYSLRSLDKDLTKESSILAQLPNALNYSKIVETDRAGYLIRQHLRSNLYDRLSSRPFLTTIEMKFITFQLLQALEDIHMRGITHGDLKTENLMLTSWTWLILTDFAGYLKPVYLPEDNPGEFSFYFDTSQRRSCYLAPERFNTQMYEQTKESKIVPNKEMDIFSAGCCIAELFSEGHSIFNLSQLFKYKNGEYNPDEFLNQYIGDSALKNLITDMIQLDPKKRKSARELLAKYRGNFFPEYFYTFFYEYFKNLAVLNGSISSFEKTCASSVLSERPIEVDQAVIKIYKDFSKVCASLNYPMQIDETDDDSTDRIFKNSLTIPSVGTARLRQFEPEISSVKDESALVFLSILLHALRNLVYPSSKLKCLELVTALSQYISDANKLDRVIPFLVSMFFDESPNVQGLAIQSTFQILSTVERLNPINENIFVDFLLPRVRKLLQTSKQNFYVRMVLADCLGEIAGTATRFQELSSLQRSSTDDLSQSFTRSKKARRKLVHDFEEITVALLTDSETCVKIALLTDILPICHLFGRERTNDVILSHLITYLNDKNSSLRIRLIQTITGVAILLGPITLEQYILPLLIQTITDSEELVVVSVLQSLKALCKVGMIRKYYFYDISNVISTLLLHPNVWIRQFSLMLLIEISGKLTKAEIYCLLYPIIRPYFEFDIQLTWDSMLSSCKKPVSRTVYNLLCTWSLRATKTLFWKQVPNKNVDSFGNNSLVFITKDYTLKNYGLNNGLKLSKVSLKSLDNKEILLTTEDNNWLDKIKTVGLHENELWKIASLRAYVFRVAKMIARKPESFSSVTQFSRNGVPNLEVSSSSRLPRNVFFNVEFVNGTTNDNLHMLLRRQSVAGQNLTQEERTLSLPKPLDLNGSLVLNTKFAQPTITPNLDNVYVQLEPSKQIQSHDHSRDSEMNFSQSRYIVQNSYEGDVKSIKEFLKSVKITPTLREYPEFGMYSSQAYPSLRKQGSGSFFKGTFVSQITEHRPAAITALAACPHNPYLITASDQGVIKFWDVLKIRSGKTFSSSLSFETGSPVTDLKFLAGFDVFAATTKDGSLLLIRVHFGDQSNFRTFKHFKVIRNLSMTDGKEYALNIVVTCSDTSPYIIALTNLSRAFVVDVRSMEVLRIIENLPTHGAVLSCVVSEDASCLIFGTSKGIIDVWDLRFGILVNSWTFADHSPVTKLEFYNSLAKKNERNVIIVGGSSTSIFTIWDYAKVECRYVVLGDESSPTLSDYRPVYIKGDVDESTTEISVSAITALMVRDHNIFVAMNRTHSILHFNLKEKIGSTILPSPNSDRYLFRFESLTANMMVLYKQKTTSDDKLVDPLNLHHDSISSMAIIGTSKYQLLASGDNSGIINFYA